jgi:hypothetical protein
VRASDEDARVGVLLLIKGMSLDVSCVWCDVCV